MGRFALLQFARGWPGRQKGGDSVAARHPAPGVAACLWGGAAAGLFTPLQWQLGVSHGPVAILAATADCLQPRFSQYWHLGFLFLNPALKRVLGCGGRFTIKAYFCFAALAWELH